jgi:hypothetical protein
MPPLTILRERAGPGPERFLAADPRELSLCYVNTSKNRKVAAVILGLAVAALAVDKFVLGGGATPTFAADASPAATEVSAAPGAAATAAKGPTVSVAGQLEQLRDRIDLETGPQLVDAFAPPRALAEVIEAGNARQQLEERTAKSAEQAEKLRRELRLTATATASSKRGAMINGTLYPLGSEVPGTGFRIKEVDRTSATLQDTQTQALVKLELSPDTAGYRSEKAN